MNVYLLVEEIEQKEFTCNGEPAEPISSVLGVYENRSKAEKEKERLDQENEEDVKQYHSDPCSYFIEERPIL